MKKTKTKAHQKQVSQLLPEVEALPKIHDDEDDEDVGEEMIEVALDGGPTSKKGVQWPAEWNTESRGLPGCRKSARDGPGATPVHGA